MSNFFSRMFNRKQDEHAAAAKSYHDLIHKLAKAGDLSDDDGAEMLAVATTIGKNETNVEQDVSTINRYLAACAGCAKEDQLVDASRKASAAITAHRELTERTMKELEDKRKELEQAFRIASNASSEAQSSRKAAWSIARESWHLLGVDRPGDIFLTFNYTKPQKINAKGYTPAPVDDFEGVEVTQHSSNIPTREVFDMNTPIKPMA